MTHLTVPISSDAEIEEFGRELDAIRDEVMDEPRRARPRATSCA